MTMTIPTMDELEQHMKMVVAATEHFGWGSKRSDYRYRTYEELILDQGKPYQGAPRPKGVRKRKDRECFRNTVLLVQSRPDLRYVEGYAAGIIPVQHAWAIDQDDRVVDPTWREPEESVYFGIVIPLETVYRLTIKHGVYGVLGNDYLLGAPLLRWGTFFPPE
jgi:hypothetical protein